jgi:hypothetical protein
MKRSTAGFMPELLLHWLALIAGVMSDGMRSA